MGHAMKQGYSNTVSAERWSIFGDRLWKWEGYDNGYCRANDCRPRVWHKASVPLKSNKRNEFCSTGMQEESTGSRKLP